MTFKDIGNGRAYNADCFDVMAEMPNSCVDMILADLPYGTTQNKWDSILPFEKLWAEFYRISKPNAAMVFTACQPFTSELVMSNPKSFRYNWIWQKERGTGHLNAKRAPLRDAEDVLIFANSTPRYFPQMKEGKPYKDKCGSKRSSNFGKDLAKGNDNSGFRYPTQVLQFKGSPAKSRIHPTQKPILLFEYLINTYTKEDDLIFDPTAGSLTSGVAAQNLGRRWVCCEKEKEYFEKGIARF